MVNTKMHLYWHTLRHLKLIQIYRRIWYRLYRPSLNLLLSNYSLRISTGIWQLPIAREPSMFESLQFRFLNQSHKLPEVSGWDDTRLEKLWLYNLHYFDDLNARDSMQRVAWHRALIKRWIQENQSASGTGWESYPTSLRVVNWIKWLVAGNAPVPGMLDSLVTQANWLVRRLEWHLLGNHLFANAKALVFAGLFFDDRQSTKWLETGLNIIEQQLPEQVLSDGGNFERSTMYHAIFVEDILDLINVSAHWLGEVPDSQVKTWRELANRMLCWLDGLTHPDGEIAFFNDAAFGIASNSSQLRAYAQRLGFSDKSHNEKEYGLAKLLHFDESGYIRMETDNAVALLDVARIGPDYLPGHAHADTLSFELSLFGQRVVVNGGTSCYGVGLKRLNERSTAAHSTVVISGKNSSEVWSGFRVARRAYPFDLQISNVKKVLKVACSHDGYTRLSGAPVHRREWLMDTGILRVLDTVCGGSHAASARYILHPDIQISSAGDNLWQLLLPGGQSVLVTILAGNSSIDSANYAPEFGRTLITKCIVVDLTQGRSQVSWLWN